MSQEPEGQQENDNKPSGGTPPTGRMFTQEELNAHIADTKKKERAKFADYDDLKTKASKLDDIEKAQLSETEKAQAAAKAADDKAAAAIKTANERLLRAAFIAEAARHGVTNPGDAYALAIADGAQVSVDENGNGVGVEDAVRALVEAGRLPKSGRPSAPGLDGGAGGASRPERTIVLTDEQKRMAQYAGMTEEQYIKYLTQPSVQLAPDANTKPE